VSCIHIVFEQTIIQKLVVSEAGGKLFHKSHYVSVGLGFSKQNFIYDMKDAVKLILKSTTFSIEIVLLEVGGTNPLFLETLAD
jgi:hypothetical protein